MRKIILMIVMVVGIASSGWEWPWKKSSEAKTSSAPADIQSSQTAKNKIVKDKDGLKFYDEKGNLRKHIKGLKAFSTAEDGNCAVGMEEKTDSVYDEEGKYGVKGREIARRGENTTIRFYDQNGNVVWEKKSGYHYPDRTKLKKGERISAGTHIQKIWQVPNFKENEIPMSKDGKVIVLTEQEVDPVINEEDRVLKCWGVFFNEKGEEIWRLGPFMGPLLNVILTKNGKYGCCGGYFFNLEKKTTITKKDEDFSMNKGEGSGGIKITEDGDVIIYAAKDELIKGDKKKRFWKTTRREVLKFSLR